MAKADELLEEILQNVREDRSKVKEIRDKIVKLAVDPDQAATFASEPLAMVGIAENVAKLSDVLTKMNAQLVETMKVSARRDRGEQDPQAEKDSIFDEIAGSSSLSSEDGAN